jgi:DNA-binding SARP family transcriptional activator
MDRDNKNNEHKERSPSPPYRVWLCGAFRVERLVGMGEHSPIYEVLRTAEWGGSSYPRLLLKALLCLPRRQARREALLEMLWSGMDTSQAANNLNTATSKLRKVLGHAGEQGSVLITEDDPVGYRLAGQDILWVDADEALDLLNGAEALEYRLPEASYLLEQAEEYLGRGGLLEEEEGSGSRADERG